MARDRYVAYLVRLWRGPGSTTWRASAQSPENGDRLTFASLEELVGFLNEATADRRPRTAERALQKSPRLTK